MKSSIGSKTIAFPTPVFVVGSFDDQGRANIMTVAWGGVCCSVPPCIAISIRKATYTYGNIMKSQAFTINIPSVSQAKEADYAGIRSGRDEDKFAALRLTPVKSELVNAPYIKEFPLAIECKVTHTIKLGLHTQFVGEVLDVKADESVLNKRSGVDMSKVQPFTFDPTDQGYYRIGEFIGQAFVIGEER